MVENGPGPIYAELLKSIAEKDTFGIFSRAPNFTTGSFFQTYLRIGRLIFSVFVIFMPECAIVFNRDFQW